MPRSTAPGTLLPVILGSLLSLVACSAGPPSAAVPPPEPATAVSTAASTAAAPAVVPPTATVPSTDPAPVREPTTVALEQSSGDRWRPVTRLDSFVPPGPAVLRFRFSRPPRQPEVEQALKLAQTVPVRGIMQWADDQTLIWQIAALPSRLDFYLGTVRDREGILLSGSLPSIQVGEPPALMLVDLKSGREQRLLALPPDLDAAALTPSGAYIDLTAWEAGPTRWDWQPAPYYIDLSSKTLESGAAPEDQPRFVTTLKEWVASPTAPIVAGFLSGGVDLVLEDGRSGRQQVYRNFRVADPARRATDHAPRAAWSADGRRVAALSYGGAKGTDLVSLAPAAGDRVVIAAGLPIPTTAALSWSGDSQALLAGNLLVAATTGQIHPVEGMPEKARGFWEPAGRRCLFSPGGDWGPVLLLGQDGEVLQRLGNGRPLGWAGPDTIYLVRWSASGSRYVPPGE